MDGLDLYEYKALTGEDIRVIRLRPGEHSQDLYAEIVHVPLEIPSATSKSDLISTSTIDETLPDGWQSFRTPEGRLFYQDTYGKGEPCQYDHPSPESVPQDLLSILEQQSWIENLDLEVKPEQYFEALSYAWGDARLHDVLYVNDWLGSPRTSQILVTQNLSSALRHLRHPVKARSLWVDAICINQNDDTEKSEQVVRIPDIYRSAWRVVAWLGEASFDSALALKTLEYLGEQIEISSTSSRHVPPHAKERGWINPWNMLPYSRERWQAVTSLMELSWFNRLWVLQEIALAKRNAIVQCGHNFVAFSLFRRAIIGLRRRVGAPEYLLDRVEGQGIFSYGLQYSGIYDLIFIAREHSCSVPHDKIFGLLGFMGPKVRAMIQPSYRKSFEQAFKEVFLAYSISIGRLELLAHCCIDEYFHPPSWVPDWRYHYYGANTSPTATNLATGMSRADFREAESGKLHCTGIIHSQVTSVFRRLDDSTLVYMKYWLRDFIDTFSTTSLYPTGENIILALERLLCMGRLKGRYPETTSYRTSE